MIASAGVPVLFRLTLARALAWSLLLAGWGGLGSIAMALASSVTEAFALIALWLFALGVAAGVATHDHLRAAVRRRALVASGLVTAAALAHASAGGGAPALLVALLAWARAVAARRTKGRRRRAKRTVGDLTVDGFGNYSRLAMPRAFILR